MPVSPPRVLLPNVPEPEKWAVIACDQFTGQPEYWADVAAQVGDAPSALHLILPEAFLNERISTAPGEIASRMHAHLRAGDFDEVDGYILVERTLQRGEIRLGLMASIDLAAYEFTEHAETPIRASEKTVEERLPIRVLIRKDAPLETPHVMVLLDDPEKQLLEQLWAQRSEFQKLYDFELNMGGGHLRGWLVPEEQTDAVTAAVRGLEHSGVLLVVGDGNHSLAAAKLAGDETALVELVNLHSAALNFEPIHRVVKGAGQDLVDLLSGVRLRPANHHVRVYYQGVTTSIPVNPNPADAIADIQALLDEYVANHPEATIDYIHGDDHLISVADRHNAVAVFMPTIAKDGLFDYTARRGVLPRKAFSIGLPEDKRYYFELARRQNKHSELARRQNTQPRSSVVELVEITQQTNPSHDPITAVSQ